MLKFIDDLAGAVYDVLKLILWAVSRVLAGMLIVAVPLYLFVWFVGLFQ